MGDPYMWESLVPLESQKGGCGVPPSSVWSLPLSSLGNGGGPPLIICGVPFSFPPPPPQVLREKA